MTEEDKLIHEFVLKNVWIGIDQTRQAIIKLDEKANNMIAVSGVLITIIGGVLISGDKINNLNSFLLLLILIPLIMCVYFAFGTVELKEQDILDVEKAYGFLYYKDYLQALGDMSISVGGWQKKLKKDILDPKSSNLKYSMECFKATLILILILLLIKTLPYFFYS